VCVDVVDTCVQRIKFFNNNVSRFYNAACCIEALPSGEYKFNRKPKLTF
jgi:hypothetical protein